MATLATIESKLVHLIDSRASDEFVRRVNEALERLWSLGTFWGMMELRKVQSVRDPNGADDLNTLVLAEKEALLGLQPVESGRAVTIWSLFNEFNPVGLGRVSKFHGLFADMGRVKVRESYRTFLANAFAGRPWYDVKEHKAAGITHWKLTPTLGFPPDVGNRYIYILDMPDEELTGSAVADGAYSGPAVRWQSGSGIGQWQFGTYSPNLSDPDDPIFTVHYYFESDALQPPTVPVEATNPVWEQGDGTGVLATDELWDWRYSPLDWDAADYEFFENTFVVGQTYTVPYGDGEVTGTVLTFNEETLVFETYGQFNENGDNPDNNLIYFRDGFEVQWDAYVAHSYKVPDIAEYWALVKLAPSSVLSDTDEVPIDNIGALKMAIMATIYEDTNDLERAASYWANAVKILNDELAMLRSGTTNPMPVMPEGPGGDPTPSLY